MANQTMPTTQDHLDIHDIRDNFVVLKNGTVCAVVQTTAVNFDLLSEMEQDAIIAAFSMLLNSITFPIQVVIRSKRLDITKYIEKVYRVENKLTDPLLKYQAQSYKNFVQEVIKKNDVLDKKFYVVIPTGTSEFAQPGSGPFDWIMKLTGQQNKRIKFDIEKVLRDGKIELAPKIDHVVKEFNRLMIKTKILKTQDLVELYFNIYNPSTAQGQRIRLGIDDYTTAIVSPITGEE